MCIVSNIGDIYAGSFPQKWPSFVPIPADTKSIDRQEVEALRRELEELKKLLVAAKIFDEKTGQPDCHMEEKVKLITDLAKLLGVDMGDVFKAAGE